MDRKLSDNLIKNYKEILVNKSEKKHTYFFNFNTPEQEIQGHYIIDDEANKWMSVEAISALLSENVYEKFRNKFFDINKDIQKQFFIINTYESKAWENLTKEHSILLSIIKSNIRQGTPRKFISLSTGEKVNIEMPFETLEAFEF
jgi:hypothetical protein